MESFSIGDILRATNGKLLCGSIDENVVNCATNSAKAEGLLFVPVIGERVDGHLYIEDALAHGAVGSLTSNEELVANLIDKYNKPIILVDDTVKALQDIARAYEKKLDLPKIGVTGSVGKTTTKEMIACALSGGLNVFKTAGNANSQIGVPVTIMDITSEYEAAVIEMGMSEEGEMERLAKLLTLNAVVMTNIGVSHIEQLKTQRNILREKWHITDALKNGGPILLNGDDPLLRTYADDLKAEGRKDIFTFGTSEGCDYRAIDIQILEDGIDFVATWKGGELPVSLKVLGGHNVLNALAAIAIARAFDVNEEAAAKALSTYTGVAMRQEVTKKNGITYINDSYNASPDSMRAGLNVLNQTKASRKIAVLADMLELGDKTNEYHYEVGKYAASLDIDELILFGELSSHIREGAKGIDKIVSFDSREEITSYLKKHLEEGDAVLFKASRGMKLNEVVDSLLEK